MRSLCIVSREYPPETAFGGIARMYEMLARALARRGVAVHVVSLSPTGEHHRVLQDGTTVHRLPEVAAPPSAGSDVRQLLWADQVATFFRDLDSLVGFDVVLAPEYGAESLKIQPGPHTALVVRLATGQALVDPERADARFDPAYYLAAQMELVGVSRADAVIAPTRLVSERTGVLVEHEASVLPSVFDTERLRRCAPRRGDCTELVFVGRLEARKAPEVALSCVAELRARGIAAHLSFVGRDTATAPGGASYRREVLLPAMADLGLGFEAVRFVEQLDLDGLLEHLSVAAAAILPSRFENFHTAAVEALALGLPVFCGEDSGLREWVGPDDGLVAAPVDDPGRFASVVADCLQDRSWCASVAERAPARIAEAFSPETAGDAYLAFFDNLSRPHPTPALTLRNGPTLGVIMLAHNEVAYTARAIESLLVHTTAPLRLVVVDNASTDGTAEHLAGIEDPRVQVVTSPVNLGVSGGRNAGLDALSDEVDYVVFVDNDIEVLHDWWQPFVGALEADPLLGIVGEDGVHVTWNETGRDIRAVARSGERCDVVVGFCMVMRPATIARIGRFDERLGLFWHDDDDYALRAARIGERIAAVRSGRVLHFEHRSSRTVEGIWDEGRPAALSTQNQRLLAEKHRRLTASERVFVLADALEAVEVPDVLTCFAKTFTAEDAATLVLYGPEEDPATYVARLEEAALFAGLDLEAGPALLAKLPPAVDPELEAALADEVVAILGRGPASSDFAHLARIDPDDPDGLRVLAARTWGAIACRD